MALFNYFKCNSYKLLKKTLVLYSDYVILFLKKEFVMTLRSNSGCNTQIKTWGWIESRGRKEMIQLVKCSEYRRVSTVYIPMYHKVVHVADMRSAE